MEPVERMLMKAFDDLHTCRNMDGPIPWHLIVLYGERLGFDGGLINSFIRIIRLVDDDLRQNDAKRREDERNRSKGTIGNKSPQGAKRGRKR